MDFWEHHGMAALVFLALFPRLTLLLGPFAFGGFLWWLGWLFAPHFLVAVLALRYWEHNPWLVVAAWFIALSGTSGETAVVRSRRNARRPPPRPNYDNGKVIDIEPD